MECKCPNCKSDAKKHVAGRDADRPGVEFIECPECGWFELMPDGSAAVCDPPQSDPTGGAAPSSPLSAPPVPKPTPSPVKAGKDGGGPPPPPEPADDEDEGGIEIDFTDEIDY